MSKKANPVLIGSFVVAGLGLIVGGVILSSSIRFFSTPKQFILYFDESLNGLSVGAPVKIRGVTVGSVSDIRIRHNQRPDDNAMPVVIEIDEAALVERTDRTLDLAQQAVLDRAVAQGLRGMLKAESLVTGILYVDLAVIPGAPRPTFHQVVPSITEIPTARTDIQRLMDNLGQLDVKSLMDRLNLVLEKLDRGLGELQVKEISAGVTNLLVSLNRVADAPALTNSLVKLERTLDDFSRLARALEHRVDPLAERVDGLSKEAESVLNEFRHGVQDVRDLLAPNGRIRVSLTEAMDELARAARALGNLANFLERNPNALISGRKSGPAPKP